MTCPVSQKPMPSRAIIEAHTVAFLRTAGGTRPDVRVVDMDGSRLVVKDFRHSAPLFRLLIAPLLIRREVGALRLLDGVAGIPRCLGRVDRDAFAMEYIDGRPGSPEDGLPATFFAQLRDLVDAMHAAGVAHCDLRAVSNTLVDGEGRPHLVDFAAGVFRGRGINPLTRHLFTFFMLADQNAVLRLKKRLSPHLLTEADLAQLAQPLPCERQARAFGRAVRSLVRALLARR